jgi:hypothetical protein
MYYSSAHDDDKYVTMTTRELELYLITFRDLNG